jgi:alpha-beta hydrolase superfamily lysophospholipase
MVDHRGFGRSDGPRGHVRRGRIFLDDIRAFLEHIEQRHPGAPLFVLGHSMGGIFAVHLAAEAQARGLSMPRGIVLMNPWVKDQGATGALTQLRIASGGMIGSERTWRVAGGPEVMTTSPDAIAMLQSDPFWVRSQSASFLYQITLLRAGMLRKARAVRVPSLVLQSERDLAVVPLATRQCYEALGSAEKMWISYPDYSHDCEFEPDRERLDNDIAAWIREQASR